MDVTLYTWSACKHCATARKLLEEHGVEFDEHALDADRALMHRLREELGRADMPFARVDGDLLGGVAELRARLADTKESA